MKTTLLLPETDLARIALLPTDEKVVALRKFRSGRPRHSWAPFRGTLKGIFNTRKALLDVPSCVLADVEAAIMRACRANPDWLEPNLELGRLLFQHTIKSGFDAIEQGFAAVPIGFGASVKFWHDFFQVQNDRPVIPFVDPRRGQGLTRLAKKFVFSAMYHHIGTGDFVDATFQIYQFPLLQKGASERFVVIHHFSISDVVDLDSLNAGVQETYELWFELLYEREQEARKKKRAVGGDEFDF
ncbi:MAG: hypothetical protein ACJ8DU_02170 [Microvirga sp.]|jgi:hypothetical protein|nr:hypothetical protein [Beijerinckiaceae bacterium]HVI76788.1 hypothetical protein [Candidatus Acidoferrum sp.]